MNTLDAGNLRVTIVAAVGLYKSDYFSFPDPFAITTIDGEQTCRTSVIEKTLDPSWNESFILKVNRQSFLTIRVFDQKKFQKKEQGFLGVVKVQIGSVIDLSVGGKRTIIQELQMSKSGRLVVQGKLTVSLSTDASFPLGCPAQQHGTVLSPRPKMPMETTSTIYPAAISPESHALRRMSVGQSSITSGNTSATSIPLSIDEGRLSNRSTTSEDAISAWNRRFTEPQVHLERNDPAPFSTVRRLGSGGIGIVFETKLDGIALALKRTYTRRPTDHLNEIEILRRITENRHKHIVELIGSYIHRQQGVYEVGLLIWPVAHCDLAVFLQDLDSLGQWIQQDSSSGPITRNEDLDLAVESLFAITGIRQPRGSTGALDKDANHLYESSLGTLRPRFGCIANAVAWLHQQGIRHKDLKPSQILLSPDGLWLTDFGWSKDISELPQSATSGGDNITVKYQSPERAQRQACSRPEDIFALGCTFIEMVYQLARPKLRSKECSAPWKQKGWSFQANLDQVQAFLKPIKRSLYESGHGFLLTNLIADMLALNADDRPSIDDVVSKLSSDSYFGKCCAPALETRPSSSGNHQQCQSGVTNYNAQRYLAPPNYGGLFASVPTGSEQPSYLSANAPNVSANASESYQADREVTYSQWHPQTHNTGADSTPVNIPSGYSGLTQTLQAYLQADPNQGLGNISNPSSGFNTHPPPAPQFQGQNPDPSFSNLNIVNHSSPNIFHGPTQNTAYGAGFPGPQRARSFGPVTTTPSNGSAKLFRHVTNALTGLDRQMNSLINDEKTGRSLIRSGPAPLPGVAKVFNAGSEAANKPI